MSSAIAGPAPAAGSGGEVRRLVKHSSIYAVGGVLNRMGAFLLLPIYTNYLTVAEYGSLELFYVVASLATGLLSAGLAHATLRFYFEYESLADRHAVVSTNLIAATTLALVGCLTIAWFREPLAQAVFDDGAASVGIMLVLATLVLELSTQVCLAYMRAIESSTFYLAIVLSRLLVQVLVNSYLVIVAGLGVTGVLIGNGMAVALGWGVAVAFVVRRCGVHFHIDKAVPVMRYSAPFLFSTIVGIVAANVDRIFIRSLLSFEALGLFALATRFSRLLEELIGQPFSRAYGSFRFSVMHREDAGVIQSTVTRFLLAGSLVAALGIALLAGDVLRLVSSASFHEAVPLLPLLLVAAVCHVMVYPLQTGILVHKRTGHIFWIAFAEACVYIVSSLLLIRWLGLPGACLAMAGTAALTLVVTDRVAQRYFHVDYGYPRWARLALIGLGGYFVGLPLAQLPIAASVPLKVALVLVVAALMFRSNAFEDTERDTVRGLVRTVLDSGRMSLVAGRA